MSDFDYAIAGAGLAGLSLAKRLSQSNRSRRLCLIEPRTSYRRDHTWCFWNNVVATLNVPTKKQWHKWTVRYRSQVSTCSSKLYPYCCVFADDYYEQTLYDLEQSGKVTLFLGETLKQINYIEEGLLLKTEKRSLIASSLFDSRPDQIDGAKFKQDFLGLHIKASGQIFDSDCVTLMDFTGIEVKRGFHFFYLLPFTESEALVESVYIGLDGLSNHEHRELLIDYLKKEYGIVEFNEVYVERGVIPMYRMSLERPHQQHYLIGTRGGFVRSSTGYAFAAIHQYADQLARSLESDRLPEVVRPLSPKAELLDAVLLNYLRERPEDGPLILSSLFEKVEPDAVVRFLSDRSTLLDEALIFAAMPKKFELASIMAKTAL